MKHVFEGKTILVTGGCGSIGSEIIRQILKYDPDSIRVFDSSEEGQFNLSQTIQSEKVRYLIGDIRKVERVRLAMKDVDIVFHAAALKHVPLCEYNPFEAVTTNVIGTNNLVHAAIDEGVEKFIGISTDKAVDPVNTMGATKLLSEKIITNAPLGSSKIKFCCVRFGNVLNSSGSVIPIFKRQIETGNTITITDNNMTRFFMDLPEAVNLVLKAAEKVEGGEIFILKMKALKIKDIAEVMVEELAPKHGKNASEFSYKVIGIRPGEKLNESLLTKEETAYTAEEQDMYILRNSLLANHESKIKPQITPIAQITSATTELLGKEEIRKIFREKKLV